MTPTDIFFKQPKFLSLAFSSDPVERCEISTGARDSWRDTVFDEKKTSVTDVLRVGSTGFFKKNFAVFAALVDSGDTMIFMNITKKPTARVCNPQMGMEPISF